MNKNIKWIPIKEIGKEWRRVFSIVMNKSDKFCCNREPYFLNESNFDFFWFLDTWFRKIVNQAKQRVLGPKLPQTSFDGDNLEQETLLPWCWLIRLSHCFIPHHPSISIHRRIVCARFLLRIKLRFSSTKCIRHTPGKGQEYCPVQKSFVWVCGCKKACFKAWWLVSMGGWCGCKIVCGCEVALRVSDALWAS